MMQKQFLWTPHHPIFYYCLMGLFLFSACTKDVPNSNDWERLHLQDKVQQFEQWNYSSYNAFNNDQHASRQVNWFSNQGLLEKGVFYESNHRLRWTHYTYHADSVWIRRTLQIDGREEQNQNYWLYELNKYGQQKTLTSLLLDTSVFYKINISFNEQQLPTTLDYSDKKNPNIIPCQAQRSYNEQLQLIQEKVYVYDKANQQCSPQPTISTYTYNEQGHILREKTVYFNGTEEIYSYQYQYDDKGNWTTRIHYKGDEVVEATKRKFTYYD